MAPAVELATGYITLAVESSEISKGIARGFAAGDKVAGNAGRTMGRAMSKGFESTQPDFATLRRNIDDTEQKITASVERNSRKQEDAKRKVEIAQAKLTAATDKYGEKSVQALQAADRLSTAQQKYEGVTVQARQEQEKLNRELGESKDALKSAERAAEQSTRGIKGAFRGIGAGIKSAISGDFKGAFKDITGDADRAADRMEREFKDAGDDAGRGFGNEFRDSVKGAFVGIAGYIGLRELSTGIWDSVNAAGALEQSWGGVDAVFGKHTEDLNAWAEEAPTRVGLTTQAYNELGVQIGASLRPAIGETEELGVKTDDLIGLGADLAATMGTSTPEAVGALGAALRGEYDSLERFGITMNAAEVENHALSMGLADSTDELTQQDKTLATHNLLMEKGALFTGTFSDEADTFSHKQEVMKAEWGNLTAELGEKFMPIFTEVITWVTDKAIPGISDISTKISEWADNLGPLWEKLEPVATWISENKETWMPFAAGIGLVAAAVGGWAVVQWGLAAAVNATIWPMTLAVIGIGLLVGAVIWAYNEVEWFRDTVDFAWSKIKEWTGALVTWWTEEAWPKILDAVQWLGDKIMWFWEDIILPAWDGIRIAIAVAAGIIITIFEDIAWILDKTLGAAFRWFWEKVVEPIFRWATEKIQGFADWFANDAVPWMRDSIDWVGDKFEWLYDHVVKPIWDAISGKIRDAWVFVKDKAFDPLMEWLDDKIPGGFEAAKDAIGEHWGKIQELAAKPIRFFIDEVYNKGLRENINSVMDKVGLDQKHRLPWLNHGLGGDGSGFKGVGGGFALGGIVPGYQAAKRDDRLIPMRSGEGVLVPEATRAIGHDAIHTLNHAANTGGENAARQAWGKLHAEQYAGNPLPGEAPFFSGGHWANVARAGSMFVKGGQMVASSFSLRDATNIWDRAAGVRVKYGTGDAQVTASYAAGNPGWYGYSTGANIMFNRGIEGSASRELRKGVAIHEIGHSLGLPHVTNRPSVMHPMMASSLIPTQSDIRALQRLYPGGTGKLGSGIDDLLDPIRGFVSGIPKLIAGAFRDNVIGELVAGIGKTLGGQLIDWVRDVDDPGSGGGFLSPKLFDGGGVIDQGFHLIEHRRKAPDYALPEDLVRNLESVVTDGNQGGIHFHAPVTTADPDELWETQIKHQRRQEALAR